MDALWRDLSLAIRQFRRRPGFALAVVSTLALAIGATIAVFSVVNAVLFRALPFTAPERLVWIMSVRPDNPAAPFTLPEFMDYRSQTRTLAGIAAYGSWSASLAGESITEGLQGSRISANAFDVLSLAPAAGRLLRESDDRPDAPKVAVLSYRLWQRRFSGAAEAVGKSIRLNGESFVIVGILPAHFPFPFRDVDVFVPLVPDQDPNRYVRNSPNSLRFFGRLNPDSSGGQAQAELITICRSPRQQRLVGAGVACGILGAVVLTRTFSGMLFRVNATDPLTYGGIALLFLTVALAASTLPAYRAMRIPPVEALRL